MILVGKLSDIEDIMNEYFGLGIVDEYLCTEDEFDWEDGKWISGSWKETKSTVKESKKYLTKGLDVDFVVDHLLSLEDSDNFYLINKLGDLW